MMNRIFNDDGTLKHTIVDADVAETFDYSDGDGPPFLPSAELPEPQSLKDAQNQNWKKADERLEKQQRESQAGVSKYTQKVSRDVILSISAFVVAAVSIGVGVGWAGRGAYQKNSNGEKNITEQLLKEYVESQNELNVERSLRMRAETTRDLMAHEIQKLLEKDESGEESLTKE
jgi:hypothetical protein